MKSCDKSIYQKLKRYTVLCTIFMFVTAPASTNYKLETYEFGAGGEDSMSSTNFQLEGVAGAQGGEQTTSTNFNINSGLFGTQMADVPPAPAFVNSANWYNKLEITIDPGSNPSDTTFAIAISKDNFATAPEFVQDDGSVGPNLGSEDFLTYAGWGGSSGSFITGFDECGITYYVKVKARQGIFTESGYGPVAQADLECPSISFDIDTAPTDTETSAPYTIDFGILSFSTVNEANDKIWIDIGTNAENGAIVFMSSTNNGLLSSTNSYTINAVTGDLSALSEGYGIQADTITQVSGGPLSFNANYNVTGDNVYAIPTTLDEVFSSSAPVTDGRASLILKSKINSAVPEGDDYEDLLTVIASGSF